MKTQIPVKQVPSKSEQDEIIRDLLQAKPESKQQEKLCVHRYRESHMNPMGDKCITCGYEREKTPPISHDKEEKVVSYTADIKTYAIIVLFLISVGFALGWYIMGGRERLIQDIDSLKFKNYKIQMNIDSLMIQKSQNDSAIEKDKKLLKEKYNTIYN